MDADCASEATEASMKSEQGYSPVQAGYNLAQISTCDPLSRILLTDSGLPPRSF